MRGCILMPGLIGSGIAQMALAACAFGVVALRPVVGLAAEAAPANVSAVAATQPVVEAMRLAAKGETEAAIKALDAVLDDKTLSNDRRATILIDRGVLLSRLGRVRQAMADFNKAVQIFPENPALYNNRGAVLLDLGFVDEAMRDFDRAVLLAPAYIAALNNRATALLRLKRPREAIDQLTEAIRLGGAEPPVPLITGRASAYLAGDRPRAALRDLDHALAKNSGFADGYRIRSSAYIALGDAAAAVEDLSRAAAFDAGNPDVYLLRAAAYLMARNVQAAIRDYTTYLELVPKSVDGYLERGHAQILAQSLAGAEADIAKGLELDPRSAKGFAYRALLFKKMGKAELGQIEVEKAAKLAPDAAVVTWARAEIDEALGRPDAALRGFRAALKQDPELKMAALGVERVSNAPPAPRAEQDGLGKDEWSVVGDGKHFFAINDRLAKLEVPMEMAGEGRPKILEWERRTDALKMFGVLRFSGGTRMRNGQKAETEFSAIVDTAARKVLAIIPQRDGEMTSKWTWSDTHVEIAAVDGLTTHVELRPAAREKVAVSDASERRRFAPQESSGGGTPAWAPWASGRDSRSRETSRSQQRRASAPSKPKTLFDLFMGN